MDSLRSKILITGAEGQLGTELVQYFSTTHPLVAANRQTLDVTNRDQVEAFFARQRPDIVFHCAAWTAVDGCEQNEMQAMLVNGRGTQNIVEACRNHGALMVYFSTDYVFDGAKSSPYIESDAPNPLSVYGKSKLAGEEAVKTMLSDYVIVRASWVYGAYGKNFVKTMLQLGTEQLSRRETGAVVSPIRVVNDQLGCPTWTHDIAKQITVILKKRQRGTVHVASTGSVTWFEFALEIFTWSGLPVELEPCTTEELARPAPRPRYSVMTNQRLIEIGCNIMPHYRDSLHTFLDTNPEFVL